jgi:outer membrane protein assembly factor BamA
MALFTDAGTVTPRLRGIRQSNFHTSYGVGGRLHTPVATMLRVDLARTSEGMGLVVAFGPSF